MKYQFFSERCSGSNFIQATVEANYPALHSTDEYGFKHFLEEKFLEESVFSDELLFLVVIRNPFDWLRSIHRKPWHCAHHLRGLEFSEFIRAEWQCVWDEQAQISRSDSRWMTEMMSERNPLRDGERFKNVMELRKVKYTVWRERLSAHPNTVFINYDAFNESPRSVLDTLAHAQGLKELETINVPLGYKGRLSLIMKLALFFSFGRIGGYKPKPKHPIALVDLDYIVSGLDSDLERQYGCDVEALVEAERAYTRSVE